MKAIRNEDGTYSLVGMTSGETISLYQFVQDEVDSLLSSGDELDQDEQRVYDTVYDLFDLWHYDQPGFG